MYSYKNICLTNPKYRTSLSPPSLWISLPLSHRPSLARNSSIRTSLCPHLHSYPLSLAPPRPFPTESLEPPYSASGAFGETADTVQQAWWAGEWLWQGLRRGPALLLLLAYQHAQARLNAVCLLQAARYLWRIDDLLWTHGNGLTRVRNYVYIFLAMFAHFYSYMASR